MKSNVIRIGLACAGFAAMLSPARVVLADDDKRVETTTTTTTTQGTVSQIGPDTIAIQTPGSPSAVVYQTKTTTYVDENGNPVAVETVKSGAPVVVYYDKSDAGKMTATRVVVKKKTVKHDDD
jgi:hypothetical protein